MSPVDIELAVKVSRALLVGIILVTMLVKALTVESEPEATVWLCAFLIVLSCNR